MLLSLYIGSALISQGLAGVHEDHWRAPPPMPARVHRTAPPDTAGPPDVIVFGYYASWAGELEDLAWERLTHVAVFNVDLNSDGTLSSESLWNRLAPTAVALAAPHGVRVHLSLTCFSDSVMNAVIASPSKRAVTVDALGRLVDAHGADGVSVDCEGMDPHLRDDFTAFVGEVQDRVDEVSVALPAVDWESSYDYAALSRVADQLFIMGYGYHWSGGNPGPVAPLFGEAPWSRWSLSWTVDDYLSKGADPARVVLGLPLYGRTWPTTNNDVPGVATGTGSSLLMTQGITLAATHGRHWDAGTRTPYTFASSTSQTWYDDTDSVREKVAWAVDAGLGGVGFWALNYEGNDPAFWAMMAEETVFPEVVDTGEPEDDDTGDGTPDAVTPAPEGEHEDDTPEDPEAVVEPEGTRTPFKDGCAAGAAPMGLWIGGLVVLWRRRDP